MIKYWLYYLRDDYELYAYTDNKEYAKLFEESRNMDMFVKVKKKLGYEEVYHLASKCKNEYLKKVVLDVYDKKKMEWIVHSLVMTTTEHITTMNVGVQMMNDDIYTYCYNNPGIFNIKIFKALELLQYNNIFRQLNKTIYDVLNIDTSIKLKPDSLGIFIHFYGKTMKG